MPMLYSKTTGCCYPPELVYSDMPEDAVEIPDDLVMSVIGNPDPGKVVAHDEKGLPYLVDAPPPTADQLAIAERHWRDAELPLSDGVVARHRDQVESGATTSLTSDQYKTLQVYRQALRDWPENASFPDSAKRPVAPDWFIPLASK